MSNDNVQLRNGGAVASAMIVGENTAFSGDEHSGDPIGDREALRRAFADPRYATSASFRQMVADAVAASEVISSPSHDEGQRSNQLNGRFQVRGNPIDEVPAERELTAHEIAMIQKAEKAGL